MIDLSLVIPLYDEEANVHNLTEQLVRVLSSEGINFEIVLVNNGSHDNTERVIDRMMRLYGDAVLKVVVPMNEGFGWGIINGFKGCRGKFVGYMGGDLEVKSEEAVRLYEMAKENPGFVFKASRVNRQDGAHRKLLSWFYNALFRALYGIHVNDVNGAPKIFKAQFLKQLDLHSKRSLFDAELLFKLACLGCEVVEMQVVSQKRTAGRSKVKPHTIFEILWDLISFRFGKEFRRWRAQATPKLGRN